MGATKAFILPPIGDYSTFTNLAGFANLRHSIPVETDKFWS